MADLSKIKLNGVEYDLKDAEARSDLANKKIVTIQATYTPQDESLDPDDIVTLTETYQDLGNYATQDEVIVLLQGKKELIKILIFIQLLIEKKQKFFIKNYLNLK